jgi:hypothetical protein
MAVAAIYFAEILKPTTMKKQHLSTLFFLSLLFHAGAQSAGDVIITEFMPDPVKVADGAGEWIELYNTTKQAININKWHIRDGASKNHTINNKAPLMVPPFAYLLLCIKADSAVNGGLHPDYVYSSFSLPNSSGKLLITDSTGMIIDSVNYSGATPGKACNLDPQHFNSKENDQAANWCTARVPYGAGDYGTPRRSNTTCVINALVDASRPLALHLSVVQHQLVLNGEIPLEEQEWDIINCSGQLVQSGSFREQSSFLSIHLNNLKPGLYIFRLRKTGIAQKFFLPES